MSSNLWKIFMENKAVFFSGIFAGLSSPSTVYATTSYPSPTGTDLERLRNDALQVGAGFRSVIETENVKEQITSNAT